jgi:putative hydrolase of the HAD superfamily
MQAPGWPAHRRTIASELGVGADELDAASALIEQVQAGTPWVAADGAAETLKALADAGYQLAGVSNAWGTVAHWLEQQKICSVAGQGMPQVATVIDSHLVGIEKPDPRIFDLALEALGVEVSRSLYVGDSVRYNVMGAQAAGLHPVHLDPYELCDGIHSHVAALAELTEVLVGG